MAFIGNKRIIEFFNQAVQEKRLAHAYCLIGLDQVGKRTLAKDIASQLLAVEASKLDTHPDFYYLSRDTDAKTGKLKKDISIGQAHQLKEQIGKKAWLGGKRIIIIDEAELLNNKSGNALLKVLEETSKDTVFFLLTTNDNALLATIRSRCQLFYLTIVSDEEIIQCLKEQNYDNQIIDDVVKLAWGRPGRALELAQDDQLRQQYQQEDDRWQKMINQPFFQRLKSVRDLLKSKDVNNKEKMQMILDIWIMIWRDILKSKIQVKNHYLAKDTNMDIKQISRFIDLMKQAKVRLRQNVNPNLLFEEILFTA